MDISRSSLTVLLVSRYCSAISKSLVLQVSHYSSSTIRVISAIRKSVVLVTRIPGTGLGLFKYAAAGVRCRCTLVCGTARADT